MGRHAFLKTSLYLPLLNFGTPTLEDTSPSGLAMPLLSRRTAPLLSTFKTSEDGVRPNTKIASNPVRKVELLDVDLEADPLSSEDEEEGGKNALQAENGDAELKAEDECHATVEYAVLARATTSPRRSSTRTRLPRTADATSSTISSSPKSLTSTAGVKRKRDLAKPNPVGSAAAVEDKDDARFDMWSQSRGGRIGYGSQKSQNIHARPSTYGSSASGRLMDTRSFYAGIDSCSPRQRE